VLKQTEASLAIFIGAISYSDSFSIAAAVQHQVTVCGTSSIFDARRMATCLDHANSMTRTYGVTVISINIVGAVPADRNLMLSLAQGAVAAADSAKLETVASGQAAAAKISAAGAAEADILRAMGESIADQVLADGQRSAADILQSNPLAAELAAIEKSGKAIGDNNAFFFGGADDEDDISTVLSKSVAAGPADNVAHVNAITLIEFM